MQLELGDELIMKLFLIGEGSKENILIKSRGKYFIQYADFYMFRKRKLNKQYLPSLVLGKNYKK